MQKYRLIWVIAIIALTSCGDIDRYYGTGYNLIVGEWSHFHEGTDSLVMRRVFTADYYSYFTYAEGRSWEQFDKQPYTIGDSTIAMPHYTQKFRLKDDTLWITNSLKDRITKYIRVHRYVEEKIY